MKDGGWYRYLRYSSIGLEMGLSVGVGGALGYWLDSQFNTAPWMLFFWAFCGLAAGFRSLFRLSRDFIKETKDDEAEGPDRT